MFGGIEYHAGTKRLKFPPFLCDFKSVPGSQLNQHLMAFYCQFTALFLGRQPSLSLHLRFLNRGPEFDLASRQRIVATPQRHWRTS
jgi:hypothetical protein